MSSICTAVTLLDPVLISTITDEDVAEDAVSVVGFMESVVWESGIGVTCRLIRGGRVEFSLVLEERAIYKSPEAMRVRVRMRKSVFLGIYL